MSIEKTNEVDVIGIDTETDMVTLSIIDTLDWSDKSSHLELVQEKINSYLRFIESGEINKSYPETVNRKVGIKIAFMYQIPDVASEVIGKASEILEQEGIVLSFEGLLL